MSYAVPADDHYVSRTLAEICGNGAGWAKRLMKKAATPAVLACLVAPIRHDLRGLGDRALPVGFAGSLQCSEFAAAWAGNLEPTEHELRLALGRTKGSQDAAVTVPLPYGDTAFCPVRALERWLAAAAIADGPVFRRIWIPPQREDGPLPLPLPRLGDDALTDRSVALIIQARAVAAGFRRLDLGGHSLKRGALTTGMEKRAHPARLKRLGRHKSYGPLGEYLEFGDLFVEHPLDGVL